MARAPVRTEGTAEARGSESWRAPGVRDAEGLATDPSSLPAAPPHDPASVETGTTARAGTAREPGARAAARAPGVGRRVRAEARMPAAAEQVLAAKGGGVLGGAVLGGGVLGGGALPGLASANAPRAAPGIAIVMIVGAVTCFSLLDTTAKWLVTAGTGEPSALGLAPLFVIWARYAVHAALLTGAAALGLFGLGDASGRAGGRVGALVAVRSWPLQALRALCMFAATGFNFWALKYLDLAQTVAIFFVAPLVVTALAGPMLGEWVGWRRWVAIGVGFLGVLVMARPGSDILQPALALSVLSMLGYSLYVLLTRKLSGTESAQSLVFISAALPALLLTPALFWTWTPPDTAATIALTLVLGLFGVGGHFLLVNAYARATTGALAPFTYAQIPMMVGLGWLLFGNLPDGWTWAGIGLIAAAGLYVLARERALSGSGR